MLQVDVVDLAEDAVLPEVGEEVTEEEADLADEEEDEVSSTL